MRFTYRLTPSEYVSAQRWHALHSPFPFILIVLPQIILPILGMLLIFGQWIGHRNDGTPYQLSGVIFSVAQISFPILMHFVYLHQFRSTRVSDGPSSIELTDAGISIETPGKGNGTLDWSALKKWRQMRKAYLLYVARGSFIVIPKRAVPENEQADLKALLDRKIVR